MKNIQNYVIIMKKLKFQILKFIVEIVMNVNQPINKFSTNKNYSIPTN